MNLFPDQPIAIEPEKRSGPKRRPKRAVDWREAFKLSMKMFAEAVRAGTHGPGIRYCDGCGRAVDGTHGIVHTTSKAGGQGVAGVRSYGECCAAAHGGTDDGRTLTCSDINRATAEQRGAERLDKLSGTPEPLPEDQRGWWVTV